MPDWEILFLALTVLLTGWVIGFAAVSAFALNRMLRVNRRLELDLLKFERELRDRDVKQKARTIFAQKLKGSHRE